LLPGSEFRFRDDIDRFRGSEFRFDGDIGRFEEANFASATTSIASEEA